ncbi:MAG: phosphoenolpyruvate--protein phosphotransferase [Phycisphaerales bacterium]|nr:phosphoenolpyruvate--protein phosphotransferase [Phycisphaerales bacterium]
MLQLPAIPVAPGLAVGEAMVVRDLREGVERQPIDGQQVEAECLRVQDALEHVATELEQDRDRVKVDLGAEAAEIFAFHLGLLRDPALREAILNRIKDNLDDAAHATAESILDLSRRFQALNDPIFREKADDLLDLERRLLRRLGALGEDRIQGIDRPVILIAARLTPAQAAGLDTAFVKALVMETGGRTSHVSIMASALGIPVVAGCRGSTRHVREHSTVVVDGDAGRLLVRPLDDELAQLREMASRRAARIAEALDHAHEPAVTVDGVEISIQGNIELAREVPGLLEVGGDGVGLFRTEYLYLTSSRPPTEEDHLQQYRKALSDLGGRTLTIRTFDLGADKAGLAGPDPEPNPMLGLRSIRYCLRNMQMFRTQLRAILRVAAEGPVRVMFPLIGVHSELRQARMALEDVREELLEEGLPHSRDLPVGMMIEVPSAALMASSFAREVDFFSIGTNDLTQYVLAVDRGNDSVASLYSSAHPAVLRMVKDVASAARHHGIDCTLCGEAASDPCLTMLLLGLGLRTLSLTPSRIPDIRRVVRSVRMADCERVARRVLRLESDRQVLRCLQEELGRAAPDFRAEQGS